MTEQVTDEIEVTAEKRDLREEVTAVEAPGDGATVEMTVTVLEKK